jgi:hypothetical protein
MQPVVLVIASNERYFTELLTAIAVPKKIYQNFLYWIMACTLGHSYDCFVSQSLLVAEHRLVAYRVITRAI